MNKALVFDTKLWYVREGKTIPLQMLRERMALEGVTKLYCRDLDDQWPEEAITPLRNYLQDVPGFNLSLVRTPSAWTEEPRKQHAYLSGQFSETFSIFTETFGDIFAEDSGDIDIRDSIHSDGILMIMIPALDTSTYTASALGRTSITQKSMILARDLGYHLEGTDSGALEVKKHKRRFPYLYFLDEVGAYYTSRIAVEAIQARSLDFAPISMAQSQERIEGQTTVTSTATLMQNTGTKFAGRIINEGSMARTLKNAAGKGARARMNNLQCRDGIFSESWVGSPQVSILIESKMNVQELVKLRPDEFFSISRGKTVPSISFFVPDDEKSCSSGPVVINGYISVGAPRLDRLHRLVSRTTQRRIPSPENVSAIIGVLTAKPSRERRKVRAESRTIIDTFQQRIAGRQAAVAMLEECDTDVNARGNTLWEAVVDTLKTTTREEQRVRYITLNRPELPEAEEENQVSVRAEKAGINLLALPQDNNHPTGRPINGFHRKETSRPDWDGMY